MFVQLYNRKEFWLAEMIKFNRTFLFRRGTELFSQNDSLQNFFEFIDLKYFKQEIIMPNCKP